MMNCNEFEKLISGYLDGELSPDEEKQFERHMEKCVRCREIVSEFEGLDVIMKESKEFLPDEAYWTGFEARLKDKIEKEGEKKPWWSFVTLLLKRPAMGVAAAILLVLMVFVSPMIHQVMSPSRSVSEKPPVMTKQDRKPFDGSSLKKQPALEEKASLDEAKRTKKEAKAKRTKGFKTADKVVSQPGMESDSPEKSTLKKPSVSRRDPFDPPVNYSKTVAPKAAPPPGLGRHSGEAPIAPISPASPGSPKHKGDAPSDDMAPEPTTGGKELEKRDEKLRHRRAIPTPDAKDAETNTDMVLKNGDVVFKPEGCLELSGNEISPEKKRYLTRSEVVLLQIVNLEGDSSDVKMLQTNLRSSEFKKALGRDKMLFKQDPCLKRHVEIMSKIADDFVNIDPKQLNKLQKKIREMGILERTRALKI